MCGRPSTWTPALPLQDYRSQLSAVGSAGIPHSHTAKNLACVKASLMEEWGIQSKVTRGVTDGAAAALYWICKGQRRALVKVRQRGHRTPLPGHTWRVSLLLLLISKGSDFRRSAALCVTETWLSDVIPDSAGQRPAFSSSEWTAARSSRANT